MFDLFRFNTNRWLNQATGTFAEFFPEQPKPISPREGVDQVKYKITVVTSSENDSGTDSGVFMTIYGDKNQTKQFQLANTEKGSELLFKPGETREFQMELDDVGTVRIRSKLIFSSFFSFELDH